MKKLLFYIIFLIGLTISGFGLYATYKDLRTNLNYNQIQKDNPTRLIISPYGTTMRTYNNGIWKSFALWSIFILIGWVIIYYNDKFLNKGRWINNEYIPILIIAIFAIPLYYYFSSL